MQGHGGRPAESGVKRARPDAAAQPSNNPYANSNRRPDGATRLCKLFRTPRPVALCERWLLLAQTGVECVTLTLLAKHTTLIYCCNQTRLRSSAHRLCSWAVVTPCISLPLQIGGRIRVAGTATSTSATRAATRTAAGTLVGTQGAGTIADPGPPRLCSADRRLLRWAIMGLRRRIIHQVRLSLARLPQGCMVVTA